MLLGGTHYSSHGEKWFESIFLCLLATIPILFNKFIIITSSLSFLQVVESIVHLLQEEDCVLEKLSINDSKLKSELHTILNALGSNNSLKTLDITGNLYCIWCFGYFSSVFVSLTKANKVMVKKSPLFTKQIFTFLHLYWIYSIINILSPIIPVILRVEKWRAYCWILVLEGIWWCT